MCANLLLHRSNKNLKKFQGPTLPVNPPSGHAFIFRAPFTSEKSKIGFYGMKELKYVFGTTLVKYKCAKTISFNVGLMFLRFMEPRLSPRPRPCTITLQP